MIARRAIVSVVTVGALAVLAGCTVRSVGEPSTVSTGTSTGPPPTSPAANPLPPRSRELDLTGLDPCTELLTRQQLEELEYDQGYVRPPLPDNSDIHGGPDCTFSSTGLAGGLNRNMATLVGISTTEGAETWVTDPARAPEEPPEVVSIEGFPALVLPHADFVDECMVVVDTTEGQYLEVSVGPSTRDGTSAEPFCAEAERVAGMAIQTVSGTS